MKGIVSTTSLTLTPQPPTQLASASSLSDTSTITSRRNQKRQQPQPQLDNYPNGQLNSASSSPLSYHEVLSQLRKYDIVCRDQLLQLEYLSGQLTDLKTVYTYEVTQNQYLLSAVAEKDHLLEYERSRVHYLQQVILSMQQQQQNWREQHQSFSSHLAAENKGPNRIPNEIWRQQQEVQTATSSSIIVEEESHRDHIRSQISSHSSTSTDVIFSNSGHSMNSQIQQRLLAQEYSTNNVGYNFPRFSQNVEEMNTPSVLRAANASLRESEVAPSREFSLPIKEDPELNQDLERCSATKDEQVDANCESDQEIIDVVTVPSPPPYEFTCSEIDEPTCSLAISRTGCSPITKAHFSQNDLGGSSGYGCGYGLEKMSKGQNEKARVNVDTLPLANISETAASSSSIVQNYSSRINQAIPVVEIEPLILSKCGTIVSYSTSASSSSSSTQEIDLTRLSWKPFDHTTISASTEKGVPHESGYAIVKVDLVQQASLKNRFPSKAGQHAAVPCKRSRSSNKTKNSSANYVARVVEEAFLEDGQKVFAVDYLKMSKQTCWTSMERSNKTKKMCTFSFTAYSEDYGRNYLCLQQDVLVFLPEPDRDRRGKLSFANFQFEPYNLYD